MGVSLDDIQRLNAFSVHPDYCASKFPVASDIDGKIARSYDLAINASTRGRKDNRGVQVDHGSIDRTTFIVGTDGKVLATIGGVDAGRQRGQGPWKPCKGFRRLRTERRHPEALVHA